MHNFRAKTGNKVIEADNKPENDYDKVFSPDPGYDTIGDTTIDFDSGLLTTKNIIWAFLWKSKSFEKN